MTMPGLLLVVLDGVGVNPSRANNAWALARTPHLDHYFATHPHTVLQASGPAVGLPDGQFGSSEVGHMTLGAGRVLEQDLTRIGSGLRDRSVLASAGWSGLREGSRRVHVVGLVSDGGVHAHMNHLLELVPLLVEAGFELWIHAITDGRDAPPHSGRDFVMRLESFLSRSGAGRVATVCGRYFAMDRTQHWDRTQAAWAAIVRGDGPRVETAVAAVEQAYARGETDEFICPTVIGAATGPLIAPNESVLFVNFRGDRMRQLAAATGLEEFARFVRDGAAVRVVCMVEYDDELPFPVLFPPHRPEGVLGQIISDAGLEQFRCAEAEKFPHVTRFFNGGRDEPFSGEQRCIVASPDVATYDDRPEMSAAAVADRVIGAIETGRYAFVLVNFANGDMVGHTGIAHAIVRAVETLDLQCQRVMRAARARGYHVLLTADHGNCEEMTDPLTGQAHTQHTSYPVPFLLVSDVGARLGIGRGLADVAPTVLELLKLPQPVQITGHSLLLPNTTAGRTA